MISIQRLTLIRDALVPLTTNVFHYWRPKLPAPYIVWAENGEADSFDADNKKAEQALTGTVDLYSKTEYDPLFDSIQTALQSVEGLSWKLTDAQYEDETGLIHHSWEWVIA